MSSCRQTVDQQIETHGQEIEARVSRPILSSFHLVTIKLMKRNSYRHEMEKKTDGMAVTSNSSIHRLIPFVVNR